MRTAPALALVAAGLLGGCTSLPDCDRGSFAVAVDPGHTHAQPGAISARGVTERRFNLALSQRLLDALHRAGFSASFTTHAADDEIALRDRTRVAAQRGARLFISIHHDSAQPQLLHEWVHEGRWLRFTDAISGHSLFVSGSHGAADASLRFAQRLGQRLLDAGLVRTLHHADDIDGERRELLDARLGIHRFDELAVLRTAAMPALLLEAGVIVNRADEETLGTDSFRHTLAAAIVDAVIEQCRHG